MNNIYITKFQSKSVLRNPEVISFQEFLSDCKRETDFHKVLNFIHKRKGNLTVKSILHFIEQNEITDLYGCSDDIKKASSVEEVVDIIKDKLNYYHLSGHYSTEDEKFIHSGLYVLDYQRVIEKEILITQLAQSSYTVSVLHSCTGSSIKAIVKGSPVKIMDMEGVESYHKNNYDKIFRYYLGQVQGFFPKKVYSDYDVGILRTYNDDFYYNGNAEEFLVEDD